MNYKHKHYIDVIALGLVAICLLILFIYTAYSLMSAGAELDETNEALWEKVVEVTAENEWLKHRIDILEEE